MLLLSLSAAAELCVMYLYIRARGSAGCPLGLQLPCARKAAGIDDGEGGSERWKIFGNIILKDGSVPQIAFETISRFRGKKDKRIVEAPITGLESAVWFKILIFDTICLDLDSKCVHWTSCNIRTCGERRNSHEPFSACQHSHQYYIHQSKDNMTADRDLEKGLEIARSILNGNNDNEHQDVLLLLHVYILPIIRLHASDKALVTTALETQIKVLTGLDNAIDKMTSERHDIKKTMKDWRQDICSQLKDDKAISNCNVHFLKLLHEHLQNDLKNAYVELDDCQERVDTCKGNLGEKRGSQYITELVEARKSRDRVAEYINKALFVMEEVHLILSVTSLPEKNELTDQHRAYIQIQEECKRHSKELHDLQRKKLLATSVREALVSTESELGQGRETTGIDITSDGLIRSTDVLGPSQLPEAWQTLPSKVSEALEKNKTLNDLHHDFSSHIVKHCREETKGQPSIKRLRPKIDISSSWRKQVAKKISNASSQGGSSRPSRPNSEAREGLRRSTRNSLKERSPTAHFQAVTQALKNEIRIHFIEVTRLLASHLNLPLAYSRSDLWSCYERAFFPGKISELLKLYVYAYEQETCCLQRILPTSNLQDMQLDDEWILNILGLYAPMFDIHGNVEVGVEATAPSHIHGSPASEANQLGVVDSVSAKFEDMEEGTSGLAEYLKGGLNLQEDIRGRLESGVEVDIPQERLRRQKKVYSQTEDRQSWRNTQIVDFKWVMVPIDVTNTSEDPDRISVQSEPCIVKKRDPNYKDILLREHELASRHVSCPEIKLRKQLSLDQLALRKDQTVQDQYLKQSATLTKDVTPMNPPLKRDPTVHLEDHIGDDSGVFGEHHEDVVKPMGHRGDFNSNTIGSSQRSSMTEICSMSETESCQGSSQGDAMQQYAERASMDSSSSAPQIVLSFDQSSLASDAEKMSMSSCQSHDRMSMNSHNISGDVTIKGANGEIQLDRELSRRCRDKPAIAEFLKRFSQAYHFFRVVLEESVPTSKLQWLLRCLKEINAVAEKQAAIISCGKQRMLSGDDLLTSLILFLIHGDPGEITAFYPQLKFLEDFLPDFLDKGEIGFCVIQFETAYSYILRVKENQDAANTSI